jgi:hypothetical protein
MNYTIFHQRYLVFHHFLQKLFERFLVSTTRSRQPHHCMVILLLCSINWLNPCV